MNLKENNFPGMDLMRSVDQKLFHGLVPIVSQETAQGIWDLYQDTGLLYREHGGWQMWGDKFAEDHEFEGLSKGPIPHSLVVAGAQAVLVEKLQIPETQTTVAIAGLVHDTYKRIEIESIDSQGTHDSQREVLTDLYGERIADLAELSGHTAMPAVVENLGDTLTRVVFWTDNAVVGTELQPAAAKCDYLDQAAESGRYPYNEEGRVIYGVPYFTFQRYLSGTLEASIAMRLRVEPTSELAARVEDWVNERFLNNG